MNHEDYDFERVSLDDNSEHEEMILKNLKQASDWVGMSAATRSQTKLDEAVVRSVLADLVSGERILTRQHPDFPAMTQYRLAPVRISK